MKRIKERARLIRPLLVPLILYLGTVALAANPQNLTEVKTLQWGLVLLPMVPAMFMAVGMLNAIRKLDELEQKILLEAAAISFILTFFAMTGLGFLHRVGLAAPNPIYISLFMVIVLLIGKLIGNRRHG